MAHISLSSQKTIQTFQTDTFLEKLTEFKPHKNEYKKIKALLDEITKNPLRKSEVMKAHYKGLRKRKKGRIRILYAYCKDCRERGDDGNRGCAFCEDMLDEVIIFFYVGLKGILYEDR